MIPEALPHSAISPSGLPQVIRCTKSLPRDSLALEDTSEQAEHGTIQHALLSYKLATYFKKSADEVDYRDLSNDEVDEVDRACQEIINEYLYLKKRYARVDVLLEEQIDLNAFLPNPAWGYVDVAFVAHRAKPNKDGIYDKSKIYVLDAKFGRVPVEVIDTEHVDSNGFGINQQLCAYWAGLYEMFKTRYEITRGLFAIIQPKLNSYPKLSAPTDAIMHYMYEVIVPKAYEAYEDKGSYNPSPKNCLHCKNRNHCKYNLAQLIAFNQLIDTPDMLDDATIEDLILPFASDLKKLCDGVLNYCLKRAEEGKKWKGFALSTGRPTRVYTDESEVKRIALDNGYKDYVVESILSPAQGEKLMGKATFKALLGNLVTYKQGKNVLVPEAEAKGTSKDFIKQENK